MSFAQLGALGLLFCNAFSTKYPQLDLPVGAFAKFVTAPSMPSAAASTHWTAWIQMSSRLMLTIDLIVVFGARFISALEGSDDTDDITTHVSALTHVLIVSVGVLIWLGFHTHYCAAAGAFAAFADAFSRFPFWHGGRNADFHQFHFFQAMTPVGGLLLLAAFGPGQLSFDSKSSKKE